MENLLDIVSAEDDCAELADMLPEPTSSDAAPVPAVPEQIDSTPAGLQTTAREIKAAFFAGKSVDEVFFHAQNMSFPAWLDFFIKLSPKEVQVKGQMDIRQLVGQMGPIQRTQNR